MPPQGRVQSLGTLPTILSQWSRRGKTVDTKKFGRLFIVMNQLWILIFIFMNIYNYEHVWYFINFMINFMIYSTENGQVEHRKGLQEEAELQRQRQRVNDLEKEVKALEAECLGRLGYRSEKLSIELYWIDRIDRTKPLSVCSLCSKGLLPQHHTLCMLEAV